MAELIEITVNYEGTDYLVVTDLHNANTLLNDPQAAAEYIKNYVVTAEDGTDVPECSKDNTGEKDKTNPKYLLDSDEHADGKEQKDSVGMSRTQNTATPSSASTTDEDTASSSNSSIKSRFSAGRTPLKPRSNVNQIMDCLKNELSKDRDDRKRHFETLNVLLHQQNQQRERFLNLFEDMVSKRRKQNDSESNESD
ncbi:hypothetical protein FQR65_LT13363 [Abscondita terminalis]|nr:hypothetical protein FQR65_LT13363 [Abscondita terminalis]